MNGKFIKLPSGMILNTERVEYIGNVNAVRGYRQKKPRSFTIMIKFIGTEEPTILSFNQRDVAEQEYQALTQITTL